MALHDAVAASLKQQKPTRTLIVYSARKSDDSDSSSAWSYVDGLDPFFPAQGAVKFKANRDVVAQLQAILPVDAKQMGALALSVAKMAILVEFEVAVVEVKGAEAPQLIGIEDKKVLNFDQLREYYDVLKVASGEVVQSWVKSASVNPMERVKPTSAKAG